jgi:hypothetical protein
MTPDSFVRLFRDRLADNVGAVVHLYVLGQDVDLLAELVAVGDDHVEVKCQGETLLIQFRHLVMVGVDN